MDVQPWGYQPVPLCVCTLLCPGQDAAVHLPRVEGKTWMRPQSHQSKRLSGLAWFLGAANSRTQAVPLLCSSASVALVCIWLSAPVSSCSPPHCCWAQQLSPRCRSSGMGHHCPALHHQEWWRRPNEVVRLLEHTEQQTWLQPSRQEAWRGRKSYCCSHTPAITSQQKAASAQPGESPRTGTARVTFTGRAADRPEP